MALKLCNLVTANTLDSFWSDDTEAAFTDLAPQYLTKLIELTLDHGSSSEQQKLWKLLTCLSGMQIHRVLKFTLFIVFRFGHPC